MTVIQEKPNALSESGKTSLLIGLGIASKMTLDLVIAARFGLGVKTDAFFVAYTLPLIIEALIYPACQSGLVPIFVRQMRPDHTNDKWAIFSTLLNIGLLTSVALTVLGVTAAPFVTLLLAPGLAPSGQETAIHLMRILFLGTLIVGPVGVMRAFLNAHGLFTAPALLELVRGTAVLCTIFVGYRAYGIEAVALGYVIGGFLQFATLASVIVQRLGFGYHLTIELKSLRSSQAGRLFIVTIADYLLGQTILITERVIGSFMPAGSISAISYGHRLASVITNVLFSGVEVVSLSSLAADFSEGTFTHLRRARETFIAGLRLVLIVGIPVSISVWVLSFRLVQLLFERGAFDRQATLLAAPVLGLYALSIPFYGYWLLLRNYLLATIQPKKILSLSCASAGVYLTLALLLSRYMGARGMALAYVGGASVVYGLGFIMLDKVLRPFQKAMIYLAARVAGASVAVGFVLHSISDQVSQLLSKVHYLPSFVVLISSLTVAGIPGAILLLGLLVVLRVEEATSFLRYLKRVRTG
jgi:putative peptidoglycan lipid II flippase